MNTDALYFFLYFPSDFVLTFDRDDYFVCDMIDQLYWARLMKTLDGYEVIP
jgi:hypothetical protein